MNGLVPELHDVLKLTDLHHYNITKWDKDRYNLYSKYLPKTETWRGVLSHHCPAPSWEQVDFYPTEPDTFFLAIADNLASSFSRPSAEEKGTGIFRTHKMWKHEILEHTDVRLGENKQIIDLLQFLATDPSWTSFLEKYKGLLIQRPEDAHQGKNITSLYTHCCLTGQFYRLLKGYPEFKVVTEDLQNKTQSEIYKLIGQKMSQWQLTIVRIKLHSFLNPFRARDLNFLSELEELKNELLNAYRDNIYFETSDEIHLILAEEQKISDITQIAREKGFWIEMVKARRPLYEIKPNPETMKSPKYDNLYDLPPQIAPPICSLCQAAKATKDWPNDYILSHRKLCSDCTELITNNPLATVVELLCESDRENLQDILQESAREELCETCFNIRSKEPKLPKLGTWWYNQTSNVAWLKIKLNFDHLLSTLSHIYSSTFQTSSPTEIRFSVIREFQDDYNEFLRSIQKDILSSFNYEDVEVLLDDFFCLKINRLGESLKLLGIYYRLLQEFLPNFLKITPSPLKFTIVCANLKFPFSEVWRNIEKADDDIYVSIVNRGTMQSTITALPALVANSSMKYRQSSLHKLAKVEEVSIKLAELTFKDRSDKEDFSTYSKLDNELRPVLDFRSILTFTKLIED